MNVSPAILLVSFTIGVPLMLLALGVLYHAYIYNRQVASDTLAGHVDALATESADELLTTLQEAVDEMREQLAHQRTALSGMLSEPLPAFSTVAPLDLDDSRPMAAGEFVAADTRAHAAPARESRGSRGVPRGDIARLAEQGLSDRAIARQLNIGLEEVRIARMQGFQVRGL